MPEEKSINGGELNPAIITQDSEFNKFLMTLPENQRQTPESKYYTYKMWKIAGKPKDFNQAVDMGLYHWNANDKSYHGNSVIYDEESDVYHFLKPKDHSTVQYELDWYNKGITTDDNGNQYELAGDSKAEWEDFRRNYYLDSSGDDYTYRRRPTLGVSDKARNGIMAALENGVKASLDNKLSSINQSLQESRVNKFGPGGDLLKAGASFIPIVGTVIDGIDLIKDPSWENAGYFAGSLASDVLGLTAIKGLAKTSKVLKAAKALAETEKATTAAKYAKLASKVESIDKLNNAKKSARAAGDRGRAYYNDLVSNKKLLEAKVAADNAEAKFKLASGVNLFYDTVSQGVQTLEPYVEYYNGGEVNKFAPGGPIKTDEYGYPADITPAIVEADYPRENEVWKRADASNADMIQRLKQGSSRVTIPDWEDPRKVATHKMMSAGKYAVGNVQNINGQLFDFTDPKHGFENPDRAAIDSAVERGDYIKFDTEGDARYFAEHYKKHYNSFSNGGPVGAGQAAYNHPKYNHKEEAAMYSYLRERGIPHTQASAIMGNIAVESMLDPNISQIGGGGGYGLIQATNKSRKNAFINYDGQPYEFGSDISPETQRQLDYIVDKGLNTFTPGEWRGNENIARARKARERFLKETNIDKASKIFTENYLRPGKPHEKRRRSMSRYFNDNYATTESALKEFENAFLFENN